ncbi:hypothetical protein EPA93_11125 [Ktedonosporobacter rubrisoli]|uniref:HEAT repeat domain-containing protein n=1 Tax=Ktedonosporobacter rubrisoli TaxID=2509675 RepID=A0A4P6JMN7_KTERU|nr:hypothetical protein [Ktedonosporobacter rubrisoli]QBD76529.1 hypothetical protein EPA93_11125 [Ktedonosporobacter rubrisoli]
MPGLAEALARTKDQRIIEPLIELATNPRIRSIEAIKGLFPFRDARILTACLAFLDYHSNFHSFIKPLEDVVSYVRTSNDPRLPDLLLARLQDPCLAQPRWNTIRLLGEFGEPHMGLLLLEHVQKWEDWYLRKNEPSNDNYGQADNHYTVAETLSKLCFQDTFDLLLRLLNAPDSSTGLRSLCVANSVLPQKKGKS